MRPTFLIARREVAGYLRSWTGYIIIALVLFADGLLFNVFALGGPDKRSSEVLSLFFWRLAEAPLEEPDVTIATVTDLIYHALFADSSNAGQERR